MQTSLFDYHLPPDRIAQHSVEPRDQAKLLLLDRATGNIKDQNVCDLPLFLQPGDLLVLNDTKVFKARLRAHLADRSPLFEIFLLRPDGDAWIALAKNAKRLRVHDRMRFDKNNSATILSKYEDGTIALDFGRPADEVIKLTDRIGEIPTPPYVKEKLTDPTNYQTIYAAVTGSAAAPTQCSLSDPSFTSPPFISREICVQRIERSREHNP